MIKERVKLTIKEGYMKVSTLFCIETTNLSVYFESVKIWIYENTNSKNIQNMVMLWAYVPRIIFLQRTNGWAHALSLYIFCLVNHIISYENGGIIGIKCEVYRGSVVTISIKYIKIKPDQ